MKRELALAVRCELELVSGLPPSQTWSINLQLSPFASGVRDGELVPDRHPDQLSRFGEVLEAVRGTQWEEGVERLRNRALSQE